MAVCYNCSANLDGLLATGSSGASLARDTECPQCRRDVRVCRNCRHYSPGSRWDCAESIDDPVYDKERRNFCGMFTLVTGKGGAGGAGGARSAGGSDDARKAFLDIFGSDPEDNAR